MRIIKLSSITFLFLCLTFGTMVSCDGDDNQDEELAGELICDDGIDNDDDGDTDCEDFDCILDPNCVVVTCDDFFEAGCNRVVECDEGGNIEECIAISELVVDCNIINNFPNPNQCIADLENFNCELLDAGFLPNSCTPVSACEECQNDSDCEEGLACLDCFNDCIGDVKRCTFPNNFLIECEDGNFRTQE